jgi:hypothetical protein
MLSQKLKPKCELIMDQLVCVLYGGIFPPGFKSSTLARVLVFF